MLGIERQRPAREWNHAQLSHSGRSTRCEQHWPAAPFLKNFLGRQTNAFGIFDFKFEISDLRFSNLQFQILAVTQLEGLYETGMICLGIRSARPFFRAGSFSGCANRIHARPKFSIRIFWL
jgi:hypothetical protein